MTQPVWIALAALCGGLWALGHWARRNPRDPWVFALWYLALGPRTDVPDMTRRELFESAAAFVTWTLLAVVALELVLLASPQNASPWLQGVAFGLGLVLLMGAAAAAYMALRGLLRRRAYLSHDRFSAELGLMPFWIQRQDWGTLDAHFRRFAERTCGRRVADAIAAVDLGDYRRALADALGCAVAAAHCPAVVAYLHRPHERWTGAFCVYGYAGAVPDLRQRRMGACLAEVPGPPCEDLARIFVEQGDALNAAALYLVARTVAVLGRCLEDVSAADVAVCMAFEGDGGLLWLRELAPPTSV
jgi:hypothetical protein